eukprot:SAG31_NODE_4055_length_3633_cov_1.566497_1_plen_141_part_00
MHLLIGLESRAICDKHLLDVQFQAAQTHALACEKKMREHNDVKRRTEVEICATSHSALGQYLHTSQHVHSVLGSDDQQQMQTRTRQGRESKASVLAMEGLLKADGWASSWAGLAPRTGWLVGQGVLVRDWQYLLGSRDRW